MQNMLFELLTGMNEEQFMRKAQLMRNPEGADKDICPVCKSKIRTNEQGDKFCVNYEQCYEKVSDKCYWHRYADGTNMWSSPEECIKAMCDTDPEFAREFENLMSKDKDV